MAREKRERDGSKDGMPEEKRPRPQLARLVFVLECLPPVVSETSLNGELEEQFSFPFFLFCSCAVLLLSCSGKMVGYLGPHLY